MKALILTLALIATGTAAHAQATQPQQSLRGHMHDMSYILDEVWKKAADPAKYIEAADQVALMREEMTHAITQLPPKVKAMPDSADKRIAVVEFHQHMARAIYLAASLERVLLLPDIQPQAPTRQQDVHNLLRELRTVADRAHAKFR